MATDKKSDYYTTSQSYEDLDGMSRSFTMIDHSKKTKVGLTMSKEEVKLAKDSLDEFTEKSILEILSLPAISVANIYDGAYSGFIERKDEEVIWREDMVRDACKINPTLLYNLKNLAWKNTVREQFWFEDMSHEDILAGKWKELT